MNVPGTLTWLHLSDAHIGDPRHAPDAEHVLDTLARDLKTMQHERGLRPDLVFFTGDAAFGELNEAPLAQQYREVARFFDGVCAAFDPPIPKHRVFIVPGNHDVNRVQATEDQRDWLRLLRHDGTPPGDKVDALIRRADLQWRRFMERLQAYASFLAEAGFDHLLNDPLRLTYAQRVDVSGLPVGVLGLNTAWSCSDDNAKGRVWMGGWQLSSTQTQLRGCVLKIALSHHPFSWLTEFEDPRVAREVCQMFDFHLHGHEHDDWIVEDGEHARIAAAACYDRSSSLNGYNFTTIDVRTGVTQVHLRAYDRQGRGWVPRCIHGRTSDRGVWRLQRKKSIAAAAPGLSPRPQPRAAPTETAAKKALVATDYFSPAREIEDAEKFVGRRKELAKAVSALRSDGASIAIFGHAGLGKTSLAFQIAHVASGAHRDHLAHLNLTHLVPDGGFAHPVVYYCCQGKDHSIAHVLTAVLRDSHPPFSARALLRSKEVMRELALDDNQELDRQLEMIRMSAAQTEATALPSDVVSVFAGVAALIARAHAGRALVVVLDEFNIVEDKTGISALLKELHFVKFVLVGTAVDIRLMVRDHASVARQLEEGQIRVREMSEAELKEIVCREEARARGAFHFTAAALLEIIAAASGVPYFVHLLGRYALGLALAQRMVGPASGQLIVDKQHVASALTDSAEHMVDLETQYIEITRGSWQREFMLRLLATRSESEVSLGSISALARSQGVAAVRTQVNRFLSMGIVEETRTDTVRFRDPRLRVFARWRAPLHDENRGRMQFIQALQEMNADEEKRRDSQLSISTAHVQRGPTRSRRS